MPRSVSFAVILILLAAYPAAAQAPDSTAPAPPAPSQDSANSAQAKKPKKVWTNENLSGANGAASVVGEPKNNPKTESSKPANAQYVASVRKQLEKLQGQVAGVDKQLVDLKNFSAGEPSASAGAIQLYKRYDREPIEAQIRTLQEKKKNLQAQIDALLDEARKKGVASSQLP